MRKKIIIPFIFTALLLAMLSSSFTENNKHYNTLYRANISSFKNSLQELVTAIEKTPVNSIEEKKKISGLINSTRVHLKASDFWLRYLEPVAYKKINGPLPVEWETEVFEKYEAPYKREGAGLTLAYLYLETTDASKDSLLSLIDAAIESLEVFRQDSITTQLNSYHHFFLCNRLYLLDLATIYTTGFECPDAKEIIPELLKILQSTAAIYQAYNQEFPGHALQEDYLALYSNATRYVSSQPLDYEQFNHFVFIRDFVNPLFRMNQQYITQYKVNSGSWMDYTLNDAARSIFDKGLYRAQNTKGIYSKITDPKILSEIDSIGKLLFYDPLLSGDNKRSCASCHKPDNYLADTSAATALQFNSNIPLKINQPSLVNTVYNHLLHTDGKFLTLQDQAKAVITNPAEMGGKEEEVLEKLLSVPLYKAALSRFSKLVGKEKVSMNHVVSAITYFYGKFSDYYAPFDHAMNQQATLTTTEINGYNLFMSKAQCGTCHFAPQFNGIKPPYINNEFEVIGVPADKFAKKLSDNKGRFGVHAATETNHAFRTPTIRNTAYTKPYMHNGVYSSLDELVDFYDAGGGSGKGISVDNQTLPADSLHLTKEEKQQLIAFINTLSEQIPMEGAPQKLPASKIKSLNLRKPGGEY
jgi:cytochrome c peroxidase